MVARLLNEFNSGGKHQPEPVKVHDALVQGTLHSNLKAVELEINLLENNHTVWRPLFQRLIPPVLKILYKMAAYACNKYTTT